jgi:hypothetical protein
MNLTSRAGRRLAAGIALASSAILLPAAALAASAAAGSPGHPAAAVLPMAGTQRGIRVLPGLRGISCHLHPLAKSHLMDADVTGDLSNRTATVDDESYRLLLVLSALIWVRRGPRARCTALWPGRRARASIPMTFLRTQPSPPTRTIPITARVLRRRDRHRGRRRVNEEPTVRTKSSPENWHGQSDARTAAGMPPLPQVRQA